MLDIIDVLFTKVYKLIFFIKNHFINKSDYERTVCCDKVINNSDVVYIEVPAKLFGFIQVPACVDCANPDPYCKGVCTCGLCDSIRVYDTVYDYKDGKLTISVNAYIN